MSGPRYRYCDLCSDSATAELETDEGMYLLCETCWHTMTDAPYEQVYF